eukprot:TRINITY_DN86930_c0_g1_i1.p1 TRINITY_DN86930_c0_g1~~TRINITY_DN86930_c0_g1_i1.p1  ORF type:complete len:233 (-),score=29.98 TRINITY_DN86930_c0_g1_i1:92-790(-)
MARGKLARRRFLPSAGLMVLAIAALHLGGHHAGFVAAPAGRMRGSAPCVSRQAEKKETTLDRLTGPKLFKTVKKVEGIHAAPLVPLRVATGMLMIHHGSEGGFWPANFGTPGFNGFVDFIVKPYFSFLPGSPELWSAIHDYAEFWGGVLLVLGLLTRPAAGTLFVTMCGAVYFHLASTGWQGFPFGHVENYSYNFEEPALYGLIFLLFFFNGAGPLSLDSLIYSNIGGENEE